MFRRSQQQLRKTRATSSENSKYERRMKGEREGRELTDLSGTWLTERKVTKKTREEEARGWGGRGGSIRKGIEFNSEGSSRFVPVSGSPLWFWRCLARSQRIRNRLFGGSGEETTESEDSSFVPGCPVERTKVFFGRHRDGDSSSHGILQNARVAGRDEDDDRKLLLGNFCTTK